MSAEDDLRRGERARMILEDELVKEALESMERTVYKRFRESGYQDHEKRETAYGLAVGIDLFKIYFETLIQNGHAAAADIEFQKKQQR